MNASELKIAVFGAGAMGTVLGALLTEGGLQVDLITRNKAHIEGLRKKGATIVCVADNTEKTIPVRALFPDEISESYDIIFLMTKQRENERILQGLLPYLKPDGVVCTTQNGLPEPSVAKIVGEQRTYGAATSFGANFLGEGRVALTSKLEAMTIEVGGYCNDNAKNGLLREVLSCVRKENFVKTTENLAGARWAKLAINAAFSGLSVVTGMTFGEVARKRKTRKIALGVLRECVAVANAAGITLASLQGHDMQKLLCGKWGYFLLPFAMRKHKNLVSGMLKDVQAGKKCEIDFVDGVVVKEGERLGVATPLCAQIVEIVHGIENGLYEISYKNADFFAL